MKKQSRMEQELIIRTESIGRALRGEIAAGAQTTAAVEESTNNASITNLIDDSDYNWSHAAYTDITGATLPGTAGDANHRAYGWFRIERATALLVDDDAHSLKGAAHSLFGAETGDTPRWERTNGWAELGEAGATPWDIACPIPNNFVTPGMRLKVQMLARSRTATPLPGALKYFWSLYDNTAASPGVIKGSPLTLDGATFGPVGATTRAYKLIIETDYGQTVESTVKTITDTPALLSPTNGVSLSWPSYKGFTNVFIYVTVAGSSFLVGFIGNGGNAFLDTGQVLGSVPSVPTVPATAAQAYAEAAPFIPTLAWILWEFSIVAPQTYDASLTTGRQWLRGGVIGPMGEGHQLQIDRIGLSMGQGVWSPSSRDQAVTSPPSTAQTSSSQGPPSSGDGSPDDGGGRPVCSTLDTPIDICNEDGNHARKVELGELDEEAVERGIWLVGKYEQPVKVKHAKIGWSELILTIKTENGAGRRCSPSDLWLLANGPASGTAARRLCEGMEVLTRREGGIRTSPISEFSASTKGEEVRILETEGETDDDRCYWAGDALAHNAKNLFLT